MCLNDMDLRKYLQQNHNKLTWKERIYITQSIIYAIYKFIMRMQFIDICIQEIYYIINILMIGILVILDFVDLLINH